jgi:hypothetical protein
MIVLPAQNKSNVASSITADRLCCAASLRCRGWLAAATRVSPGETRRLIDGENAIFERQLMGLKDPIKPRWSRSEDASAASGSDETSPPLLADNTQITADPVRSFRND